MKFLNISRYGLGRTDLFPDFCGDGLYDVQPTHETWYISFDFYHHSSESLTLSYPVHIETLAMIYWNSCVAPTCQKKSQLYKIMVVM